MGWAVNTTTSPLYPLETQCPFTGGWVGPRGRVWTGAENLAPQLGFDPRTVQHVSVRNYGR